MAIKAYKTRAPRADSGLPELGRIFKGAARESQNQKQIPPDLNYFRFEPTGDLPTVTADELRAAWVDVYGPQPRVLRNCQFAVDSIDGAFSDFYETWGRSSSGLPLLNKKCDGETILFERDGKTIYREPAPCEHKCECKPTGRLRLFLPELCKAVGVLGVVTLMTHATTDLDYIRNTLTLVRDQLGGLRNVAFVLHRVEEQLMTPDGFPVKKWVVRLDLETAGAQKVAQLAAQSALALPSGPTSETVNQYPPLPALTYSEDFNKFDENGDDLPEPDAPDKGTGDVWEDFEQTPPAQDDERLIGTAVRLEIRSTGRGKSYHVHLDNNAKMILQGFDGIRAISPAWAAYADSWKEWMAGTHDILALRIYTGAGALRFEADRDPEVSE